MTGWFLKEVSLEGFRGVNNEGAPLRLKLNPEKVNSVSAPNGVGKTSIFDSVLYAIKGSIPKLEGLPAAERGGSYYLNQFHTGKTGHIQLTLQPENGDDPFVVSVERDDEGNRTVTAPDGVNGDAVLEDLNREFVLLDGQTFRDFIEIKPLERGRSFAGLLGLRPYSNVRQGLADLSNTRAFNNHFSVVAKKQEVTSATSTRQRAERNISEAYKQLVGEDLDPNLPEADLLANAHTALSNIALLKEICADKTFEDIGIDECVQAAKTAEGGEDREKLSKLIRQTTEWKEASASLPSAPDREKLVALAKSRDEALQKTQGDQFRQLYALSEKILKDDQWDDKTICPVCDRGDDNSVLDHVSSKIAAYEAVSQAAKELSEFWNSGSWADLKKLETLAKTEDEKPLFSDSEKAAGSGSLSGRDAQLIATWASTLSDRYEAELEKLTKSKEELEKKLPPKLTAVVEKVEAARRLQSNLVEFRAQQKIIEDRQAELHRIERVKGFLDGAGDLFAGAESDAAKRRLEAIEPKCREFFAAIMFEDVTPALAKREGREEISISLSDFWSIKDVSAQALLSESFRNAFAISVYLAAASLYGGPAKFLILDDVTSSFDSGHQLHLMNVIKDKFGRPGVADGPQVILLSHDPMLEKLFNKNSNEGGWWHQCIQGTPRTEVLPQSGAASKIRDVTIGLLDAGNVHSAAPRIRQHLEFKLEEVIQKVQIPVPITIAYNDDKHMAQNLINAIKSAVDLQKKAGQLVLEAEQETGMGTALATIVSNYVSHWATGQSQTFTAASLKGVMQAIDDFARCFQYEDPAGSGHFRYYKSLDKKS